MKPLLLLSFFLLAAASFAQNVGIGTTTPHPKAALEIKATDKGILFPRLTSVQRNAIANPPDGLHIYNTDEHCLNYFDSAFQTWSCYCESDTCKVRTITLAPGCGVDFNAAYAGKFPAAKKYAVLVNAGDTISGCGTAALDFSTLPGNATIVIINRGVIIGAGGSGGAGATGSPGSCTRAAVPGSAGGHAILSKPGVTVHVENFGLIAAGGGGGGGGGSTGAGIYGGGGGGGAGYSTANGGTGGGGTISGPFGSCGTINSIAQNGTKGQITLAGSGGTGANGGGNGGAGGGWAQKGQPGTGTSPGAEGAPGKAITGSTGNSIVNRGSGQVFGVAE